MAVFLKKRALVEYGSVGVTPVPEWKRFKIFSVHQKKDADFDNSQDFRFDKYKSHNKILQVLSNYSGLLEPKNEYIKWLIDNFGEFNSVVRERILLLFSKTGRIPISEFESMAEVVIALIKNEKSHKVNAQGLLTLLYFFQKLILPEKIKGAIIDLAKTFLVDTNSLVKTSCLKLLSESNTPENIELIGRYIFSQDARVRITSLEVLVLYHQKGFPLDISLYPHAVQMLSDDYDTIRQLSLKLVAYIGIAYPDGELIMPGYEEPIRLIDDAFSNICQEVFDSSSVVRLTAVGLLGDMWAVSEKLLSKTLDKRLMSNMRRKESLHQRSKKIVSSGEWMESKKWADDKPLELLDKSKVSCRPKGAESAFVQGLEDDFSEVRVKSIDSLSKLAIAHPKFATQCLDFFVDMLNDEIESVRISSIEALKSLSSSVTIMDHQLDSILSTLDDTSSEIRRGLHKLLSMCTFSSTQCIDICINYFENNLLKYPQDRFSVWSCAKYLGENNFDLLLPLATKLLGIHMYFDLPSQNIEDPFYTTVLISIFNAASNCCSMASLFDENVINHYYYLRATQSDLVPPLPFYEKLCTTKVPVILDGFQCLWGLIDTMSHLSHFDIELFLHQIEKLKANDKSLTDPAEFIMLFIKCQHLLKKILSNKCWYSKSTIQDDISQNEWKETRIIIFKLTKLFSGLQLAEEIAVKELNLIISALSFIFRIRNAGCTEPHFSSYDEVNTFRNNFSKLNITPSKLCTEILSIALDTNLEDLEKAKQLQKYLVREAIPGIPKISRGVKCCRAYLNGPTSSLESPIKFIAGIITSVKMDGSIYALTDVSAVRIKVQYPDNQTHIFIPKNRDISPKNNDGDYFLKTDVLLVSYFSWTEACYILISLCIDVFEKNVEGTQELDHYLDISEPFKVHIRPKKNEKFYSF